VPPRSLGVLRAARHGIAIAAAALLLAGASPARADDDSGDRHETLSWSGRERSYMVHVPQGAPGGRMPLVVVLHGAGGSGAKFAEETGFAAAADKRHMVVVFPDGIGAEPGKLTWDAHFCCGLAVSERSDDVGFVMALIDRLSHELPIDEKRVYATGMSNGAMLSYQLAAAHPRHFAAIAPVSGTIGGTSRNGDPFEIAMPDHPVPVMIIHGRKDPFVLFDGGTSALLNYPKRSNMSVAAALAFWSKADGCAPEPERTEPVPGKLRRVAYAECRGGSDVVLWEIEEGDHSWPASDMLFPMPGGGSGSAADEILAFFAAHRGA
jgi:polyhydroxybutyrate depolymerase